MFNGAMEAVRQLRDPAGGPLLDQLREARPQIKSLEGLRWGFFGHSVGADMVFPLSLEFMKTWGDVAGGVASINPTGNLAIVKLSSDECLLYPGDLLSWNSRKPATLTQLLTSTIVILMASPM